MASVLEERAAVEREIEGQTICDRLRTTAEQHPERSAYSARVPGGGGWQTLTWGEVRNQALELAAGFIALGLEPGDAVALMMPNRPEHVLADLGVVHAGGVPTTVYATLAPDQVAYVAGDCAAKIAVLDGADQVSRWGPVLDDLPHLQHVIVVDPAAGPPDSGTGLRFSTWDDFVRAGRDRLAADAAEVERRWQAVTPTDTLTVLYTSGTTGNPKGVLVTHRMALYEAAVSAATAELPPHDVGVSYLPFAHIADRMLAIYLPIIRVAHIHFCPDPTQLLTVLQEVRPHGFFGVPRVWEKLMAGIQAALGAEPDAQRKAAVAQAMETGLRYVNSCQFGQDTPPELAEAYQQADETVLSLMRSLLGLDRVVHALSAAAPLPVEAARFFAGLGLKIFDVYGMTETTGAATANVKTAFKLGTVGRPLPGMELRLADDGEILIRGTTCTPGYLARPEATTELLDADGWVHTGDIGVLDNDGFLSVVDRKKEIIITAGGENIAPSMIENLLKEHPLVGQALVYGDGRPYVVAVLTLDGEVAPAWAQAHGIEVVDLAALVENPLVLEEVGKAVADANARLARVQQVKSWRLLSAEWTAESEELTPTLKLRRRVVHAKYADAFDSMYGG